MPILDITFTTPLVAALMYFSIAARRGIPASHPASTMLPSVSNARYGLTAPAP